MRIERATRIVATVAVLALIGAACGSDDPPESRSFEAGDDAEGEDGGGGDQPLLVSATGNQPIDAFNDFGVPSRQEFVKKAKQSPGYGKTTLPNGSAPAPKEAPRVQGAARQEINPPTSGFYGITRQMNAFVNADGSASKRCCNCGQAAAASVLDFWGYNTRGDGLLSYLDTRTGFQPDVLWGAWGTWPNTVRKILLDLTPSPWKAEWYTGEAAMKTWLRNGWPVIVLVDTGPLGTPFNGHYMVVYGYTSTRYYVSNYSSNYISASTFRSAWSGGVPTTAGVGNKFLLLYK